MASILKLHKSRGFSYRVFIRRKGLKPITKVFSNRELAESFVERIEGNKEMLLAYGGSRNYHITFKQLATDYLKYEYTGKDIQKQESRLGFWVQRFGFKYLTDITRSDINSGVCELSMKLSNATVNRYRSVVSVVFSYACRQLELADNPVRYIHSKPENNERTRFLSEAERTSLFKACKASSWDKLYLLVLLAITTGARKGELTKLRWNDIDFDRRTAYVATTKNGQPKVLPLTDSVIRELQLFDSKDSSLIFASKVKEEAPYCFTKPWKKALENAEINDFRFHDLRHCCATYLAQSGASLLMISFVLGHKDIRVTQRYAHLCVEQKSRLINRVLGSI